MMLNAIGISGKSANKLRIYLLFNEFLSELASISPVISCNGGKLFTESTEQQIIFQIWTGKARLRFAFNQFRGQKCFLHVNVILKRNITRAHFRSSGKFWRGKDRQKWITSETPGTGLKESPSTYVLNVEFVLKWMISPSCVIGIFIFSCSLSKNGVTNAKIQSSSTAISKLPCNNLIFSADFLNCKYQQHLQSATLYTENWLTSSFSNCEMNTFNFILNALIRFIKLGNNLFLLCSLIFRWFEMVINID